MATRSPVGQNAADARRKRARRSAAYRAEQARLAPYEDVARMIVRLRLDHDLTQEALAERVGTSKTAISRLESGRHAPTAETLRKIAGAFGGHLVIGLEMPVSAKARDTRTVLARVS
jgi:ribosome-binding protein aMBF1 (putative translation factor)